MTWNYRVVYKDLPNGTRSYEIHEVYYDDGTPKAVSESGVKPWGESLEELKAEIARFQIALTMEPLSYDSFGDAR